MAKFACPFLSLYPVQNVPTRHLNAFVSKYIPGLIGLHPATPRLIRKFFNAHLPPGPPSHVTDFTAKCRPPGFCPHRRTPCSGSLTAASCLHLPTCRRRATLVGSIMQKASPSRANARLDRLRRMVSGLSPRVLPTFPSRYGPPHRSQQYYSLDGPGGFQCSAPRY